ncbi:hypothetical protein ACSBR1_000708 [Camellia fascicularis]
MGRAPCCDKANVKKGPWSPEEDAKLKSYIEQHGTGGNWIALPQKIGLKRCGKSCRLRWLNYLRPNIRHGGFSEEEDNLICSLYISIGSRWSIIAAQLPGRTDNDIKNYWNTRLKKKLLGKQRKEQQARRGNNCQKQRMRKGNENSSMVSSHNTNNQVPYWPELPAPMAIPYSNQEPRFNDHVSIRKVLIKLGGKFSDDHQYQHPIQDTATNLHHHHHHQFLPVNLSYTHQAYAPSIEMVYSSSTDPLNTDTYQLVNTQYGIDGTGMTVLPAQTGFQAEFEEMLYNNNNPQRLDGLEFFYGDMVVSNGTETTSGESMDWGEMSSMSYPPMISNYEGLLQQGIMLQESTFDELKSTTTV